jgi:hypothetical protein
MNTLNTQSLADALRKRAHWLMDGQSSSSLEYSWGNKDNVIAALYEMADVIDSWSGEYLSKEETYEENQRRRWGSHWTVEPPGPMTMEERRAAVRK